MNASSIAIVSTSRSTFDAEELEYQLTFWKRSLFVLLVAGILCGVAGLLLSFDLLITGSGKSLSAAGTVLVAAFFPLIFLAAHCMDKVGAAGIAIRKRSLQKARNPVY